MKRLFVGFLTKIYYYYFAAVEMQYVLCCFAEKVSFIDFEYVGYNYQAFDIGNHFCEYAGL